MIIYVDVLFVINFFITYLLLLFTSALLKQRTSMPRMLAAAFEGGLYSLVILVDSLSFLITVIGKLAVSLLIVFTAFGFKRLSVFIKTAVLFYFSNMLFLGIICAVIFAFKTDAIAVSNGVAYFDISAKILLVSAAAAYIISIIVIKIYNHTTGKNEIYSITIFKGNNELHLYAFADSGNKLREPFSDYPVIVADKSKVSFDAERVIPFNTVAGEGVLQAFKPDKVVISNSKVSFETDKVYVAMSNIDSKDFSAILNPQLLNI
ncbi:MAG: sigma-E processing peptidase SpoIIGA [Eubacterium sp.]